MFTEEWFWWTVPATELYGTASKAPADACAQAACSRQHGQKQPQHTTAAALCGVQCGHAEGAGSALCLLSNSCQYYFCCRSFFAFEPLVGWWGTCHRHSYPAYLAAWGKGVGREVSRLLSRFSMHTGQLHCPLSYSDMCGRSLCCCNAKDQQSRQGGLGQYFI
jgi:hypothetical protein